MALRAAAHREAVAQLCLCAGIASFVLAMTVRRLRREYLARHRVSSRSRELTSGGTPEYILEHIKRLMDEDYVCLAIAENKLTVREEVLRTLAKPFNIQYCTSCAIYTAGLPAVGAIDIAHIVHTHGKTTTLATKAKGKGRRRLY